MLSENYYYYVNLMFFFVFLVFKIKNESNGFFMCFLSFFGFQNTKQFLKTLNKQTLVFSGGIVTS